MALLLAAVAALSYNAPLAPARPASAAAARSTRPVMDETIIQKALLGELEQEGAENVFMSELGWATYLDKQADSSYNMNEKPSKAQDGYFTPDIFSNPIDVTGSWAESMKRVASDPFNAGFMTISNDPTPARSFPKGLTEVETRTIKPKTKNFDKKMRVTGLPGVNVFG